MRCIYIIEKKKKNVAPPKLIASQEKKIQIKSERYSNGVFQRSKHLIRMYFFVVLIEPSISSHVLVNKMNALQVSNKHLSFSLSSTRQIKLCPVCLSGMCLVAIENENCLHIFNGHSFFSIILSTRCSLDSFRSIKSYDRSALLKTQM